ncbi:hypothetical protein E2C01_088904 [Portunus trituberculatus]|uniref:Uncharacterized protein n=1 Tax=Portunus trituberculatus TaxID=210409 RepID=A0A5B7JHB8_PORTR|nr:hypothetical protein [Portunus trituberculatus]
MTSAAPSIPSMTNANTSLITANFRQMAQDITTELSTRLFKYPLLSTDPLFEHRHLKPITALHVKPTVI